MNALERMWKDRMDIYRYVNETVNNVTGSTKELKYSGVKCHYSKGSLVDTGTDGVPTLVSSHTLFCSIDTDLQEGDEIIVTQRNGRQASLKVGEGFPYANHQEFRVKRDDTV